MKFKKGDLVEVINRESILYRAVCTVVKQVGIKVYVSYECYLEPAQRIAFHERDLMLITRTDTCTKTCNEYIRCVNGNEGFGYIPEIRNVCFNDPLTIVIWKDGTKTFVKNTDGSHNYDPEKALAMAISKKALGNKYKYYQEFEKWLPEEEKENNLLLQIVKKKTNYMKIMTKTQNPIERAYLMLLKIKDDPESMDIDTVIGYLGEILDD